MKSSDKVFAIVLALAAAFVFGLEIWSSPDASRTETSLFGILQFLFSIGFAWIVTRWSARDEFQQSQRRFAIAAYRRIREVEGANDRLTELLQAAPTATDRHSNIVAAREIVAGVSETIRSSIADWAEVIGEEIETVEKISRLQARERTLERRLTGENDKADQVAKWRLELKDQQAQLSQMLQTLPHSLRIAVGSEELAANSREAVAEACSDCIESLGFLRLFVYCDEDFELTPSDVEAGQLLQVGVDDGDENRTAVLVARTDDERKVGVVLNVAEDGLRYQDFMVAFLDWLGHSTFQIKVLDQVGDNHLSARLVTPRRQRSRPIEVLTEAVDSSSSNTESGSNDESGPP